MYKQLLLFAGVTVLAVLLWSLAGKKSNTSFEEAQALKRFRRIGHELLLSAGETQSHVLPIQKVKENEFRVEFEDPFSFCPDSLVAVVSRILHPSNEKLHYVVNATEMDRRQVMYSFGWPSHKVQKPCLGRDFPEARYALNILVSSRPLSNKNLSTTAVVGGSLLALGLGFFAWHRLRRKTRIKPLVNEALLRGNFTNIGQYRFFPDQQVLVYQQQYITLTTGETNLLRAFCESPNEVIARNRLVSVAGEEEGGNAARNLDAHVARLRKKLQHDLTVSIIDVHGKGYRLIC